YLYADVSDFTSDSFEFAGRMLEKAHVAATPGVDFDPIHGRAFIRFSYARSADEKSEAVARLARWLGSIPTTPSATSSVAAINRGAIRVSQNHDRNRRSAAFPARRAALAASRGWIVRRFAQRDPGRAGNGAIDLVSQGQSAAALCADDAADARRTGDRRSLWLAARHHHTDGLSGRRGDRISGLRRSCRRPRAARRSDGRISLRLR